MAQASTRTRERDPVGDTFAGMDIGEQGLDMGMAPVPYGQSGAPSILPARQGDTSINILAGHVTAQRVAIRRQIEDVKRELTALAAMAGADWVWGWFVKDKNAPNGRTWIEGPTIKLANDLARVWGNCDVRPMVVDEGSQWVFYARFVDLETGYTLVRAYQQRKSQNTGMKDNARALDMIFQLGQSKAIRNVVVNALQTITKFCVEEAKASQIEKIKKDPEKARGFLLRTIEQNGVDLKRVEKVYGRSASNWTPQDMAKIMSEVTAFGEGMASQEEMWPLAADEQPGETIVPKSETKGPEPETGAASGETKQPAQKDPPPATARPAGATDDLPDADVEPMRVVVLEGGVPLGKMKASIQVKIGVAYEMFGSEVEVVEFNSKEVVVRKVPPPEKPPAAAKEQPAAKKSPGSKAKAALFGDD